MSGREMHWRMNEQDFKVRLEESQERSTVEIDGESTTFRIIDRSAHSVVIDMHGGMHRVFVVRDRNDCTVWWNGRTYRLQRAIRFDAGPDSANSAGGEIRAPMPGKVLRIDVQPDAVVEAKEALLLMESMKMETVIPAPRAGRITDIRVKPGQVVEMGELLLTIE